MNATDEALDGYVSWREECQVVRLAFERLAACGRRDRRVAYAAYLAALDREHAARTYAQHVRPVIRSRFKSNRVHGKDHHE